MTITIPYLIILLNPTVVEAKCVYFVLTSKRCYRCTLTETLCSKYNIIFIKAKNIPLKFQRALH